MSNVLDGLDRAIVDRLRRWGCGRCGARMLDVNMALPSELVIKCPKCREATYNVLRVVVVSQDGEQ